MATREEREKAFIKQRAAELRAQGKPVDRAALAQRFDTLSETKEGRQTITAVVQRAAEPVAPVAPVTPVTPVTPVAPAPAVTNSPRVFIPEEDAATIPPSVAAAMVASGALAANQPGLNLSGTGLGAGAGTGTGAGAATGTGAGAGAENPEETEEARIARLDREQRQAEFEATQAAERAATSQRRENAFGIIGSFLQRAGLAGLEGNIRQLLAQGIEDTNAILFSLRDTEQFKTRFKANAARAKKGLPELDPATYIGLEQSYSSLLRANRLPAGFYDQPDDFNALIEGDVSPQELQARISEGFAKVRDADPQVRAEMQRLYGVGSDEQLAAFFLDPQKGLEALQREARAAEIAARGTEQGGLQLTQAQAEDLAQRGITAEEAQRRFTERGLLAGLYQPLYGEEALTQERELGATFGFDPEAQLALERRRAQRVGEFQAGGQFARTTGATSGTVETGVGTAQ